MTDMHVKVWHYNLTETKTTNGKSMMCKNRINWH